MLFWLGAGADGAGAVVLAVVVVVLGVVVVEGLVGLFPPQPAVIAPSATTMTALAITRVWRAVGDGVTFQSSLLPMIDRSAGRSLLGAVLRRPGSSQYAPFEGERATPDPGPCSRPGTYPKESHSPFGASGRSLGLARINSCYLVGTGDADAGTGSVRAR
jgi:hypothetical protein